MFLSRLVYQILNNLVKRLHFGFYLPLPIVKILPTPLWSLSVPVGDLLIASLIFCLRVYILLSTLHLTNLQVFTVTP